jgi:DNA-binding MarR family transcriptional regulator
MGEIYSLTMQLVTQSRAESIDVVSSTFMSRASRLTRLLASSGSRELSRTEVGLLVTLLDGPHRITDLAETEALAQPTVTKLVDNLQQRGLVARERPLSDGRVVLVSISAQGRQKVEAHRTQLQSVMRDIVDELTDDELDQLVAASEIMGRLIDTVQVRKATA